MHLKDVRGIGDERPWATVVTSAWTQKESRMEHGSPYSEAFPDAPVSIADLDSATAQPQARVEHCTVADGASSWTFEHIGPFIGHGAEWHSGGWNDAGRFGQRAKAVWCTAFSFFPMDSSGEPLGLPPIHIHHMHVSSSQSMTDPIKKNSDGLYAVEFDLHGDRQCAEPMGGMNCTVRAFPPGFGMRLEDRMQTFFDLKDVRPAGSSRLDFYAQHMYRWTTTAQRPVGKMMTGISTLSFKPHDDYLLVFDPSRWGMPRPPAAGVSPQRVAMLLRVV